MPVMLDKSLHLSYIVEVLRGSSDSGAFFSHTACSPAGCSSEAEVVRPVVSAHERTAAVTLQLSRED